MRRRAVEARPGASVCEQGGSSRRQVDGDMPQGCFWQIFFTFLFPSFAPAMRQLLYLQYHQYMAAYCHLFE